MIKSIKITIIIIGLLSIGAGAYSFIKRSQDQISYFALKDTFAAPVLKHPGQVYTASRNLYDT